MLHWGNKHELYGMNVSWMIQVRKLNAFLWIDK